MAKLTLVHGEKRGRYKQVALEQIVGKTVQGVARLRCRAPTAANCASSCCSRTAPGMASYYPTTKPDPYRPRGQLHKGKAERNQEPCFTT